MGSAPADSQPVAILVWLLPLTVAVFTLGSILRRAYLTPLAAVPGPWLNKFTSLPLMLHVFRARRVQYVEELHQIYGGVVRIAPNEVDVSDLEGYHAIHKIGQALPKSQWYPRFRTAYPDQDVFSETDVKKHAVRRKVLSRPFSKSNLKQNWSELISERARLAISKIKAAAESGECNIFDWWQYYTFDVIAHVSFGEPFGVLERGEKTEFLQVLERFAFIGILRAELTAVYNFLRAIPSAVFDINKDEKWVIRYGREVIDHAREGPLTKKNIFTGFLTQEDGGAISKDSMVTEATGLIGAGSGTTSVALTYLVWEVLRNPHIQSRLEAEVATLPVDFSDAGLEALPYLNAVIEETLRTHGPIPGSLSRVVSTEGLRVAGYFLPRGTIVCTQSYSMHLKPEIYSNPERFDPERFLQSEYARPEQKTAFAAFGAGARTCLGVHLAYMELRMGTALFFRECAGARLAPSSPDDMEMLNFFGGVPKGRRCNITLVKG